MIYKLTVVLNLENQNIQIDSNSMFKKHETDPLCQFLDPEQVTFCDFRITGEKYIIWYMRNGNAPNI
jgi:hypothetical protein